MAITDSTYFNFTRIREVGPEARDWAAVDKDWETVGLILKAFENHHHDGTTTLPSPAFYTAPVAPTIANVGTAGVVTYSYCIVAKGPTLIPDRISAVGTTSTGNATLDGTNYNTITWAAVTGATSYDVVRVTGGTTQGKLTNTASTSYSDQGAAATAYTPSRLPVLTENSSGGILPPGASVSVRLSYVNALGLETDASSENAITLSAAVSRPLTPALVSTQVAANAIAGGTYLYVLTKQKGTGETVISDPLAVTIPYDNTYSVTLSFNPLSSYSDGTTAINIYRTTGLASSFTQVGQITVSGTTTYTDNNSVNVNTQPPTVSSTFDAARKVHIDWSALTHPTNATKLRVYVTQQPGIYGTNCLLKEWDLTASPPTSMDYLGSETLQSGWPSNSTEIPASPPKLNLGTEATGGFTLTADSDFAGFKAKNMSVNFIPASPTDGMFWYDSGTGKFRGRQSGSVVDLSGVTSYMNGVFNPSAVSAGGNWITDFSGTGTVTSSYITTDGYIDATSFELHAVTTAGTITNLTLSSGAFTPTTTAQTNVTPGQIISVSAAVKAVTALTANSLIRVQVQFQDSAGTALATQIASGAGSVPSITNPTANTWYNLFGTVTAPANAYLCKLVVFVQNTISPPLMPASTDYRIRVDAACLVPGVATTATYINYFDGNSVGAYWKGTVNNSQSVLGGFQHSAMEIGGHDASHIVLGSAATGDVGTLLLGRFADPVTGGQRQVITPQKGTATTSNPTTTSTSPADIPEMVTAVTPTIGAAQYVTHTLQGNFTMSTNGMTANFGLEIDGVVAEETKRVFTATADNQPVNVHITYDHQISNAGHSFKGKWWVSSGTLTAVTTRRSLVSKLVV